MEAEVESLKRGEEMLKWIDLQVLLLTDRFAPTFQCQTI